MNAAVLAVLSADEIAYTMDRGILELGAGMDDLLLGGTYDGPPPR